MLITGAGGGVGKHIALNFARLKAKVVIWDVNRDGKQKLYLVKNYKINFLSLNTLSNEIQFKS